MTTWKNGQLTVFWALMAVVCALAGTASYPSDDLKERVITATVVAHFPVSTHKPSSLILADSLGRYFEWEAEPTEYVYYKDRQQLRIQVNNKTYGRNTFVELLEVSAYILCFFGFISFLLTLYYAFSDEKRNYL